MIALGSQNGSIYLFRVTRDGYTYKRQSKIRGTQPLQHLDWSVDGFFLQSVTTDFDLLFCEYFSLMNERTSNSLLLMELALFFRSHRGYSQFVTRT